MAYWPIPSVENRHPEVSHEFEPHRHLGVDIMFRKPGGHGWEMLEPGKIQCRSVVAGEVIYARHAKNGWRVRIVDALGHHHLYIHLLSVAVREGDWVAEKVPIGVIGYDPSPADPDHVWHLHYELRIRRAGDDLDDWKCSAVDPASFIKTWQYD